MPEVTQDDVETAVKSGKYSWIHLGGRHNKYDELTDIARKVKVPMNTAQRE